MFASEVRESGGLVGVQGEGLFDQGVESGFEREAGERCVRARRGRYVGEIETAVGEQRFVTPVVAGDAPPAGEFCGTLASREPTATTSTFSVRWRSGIAVWAR